MKHTFLRGKRKADDDIRRYKFVILSPECFIGEVEGNQDDREPEASRGGVGKRGMRRIAGEALVVN